MPPTLREGASGTRAETRGSSPTGRRRSSAPARILAAAEDLLIEAGADGISIRKVQERSGYTAPTIYHHFGDKQGLIDAVLEARYRELLALMRAIPDRDDPATHLREMGAAFVAFAIENPSHYQLLVAPRGADPVPSAEAARALVREDLAQLARAGELATDDLDAAFDVLWAVLHGVIALKLGPRTGQAADQLETLAFDVVDAGLLLTAGRATPRAAKKERKAR